MQTHPAEWLEQQIGLVAGVVRQVARAARVPAQDVPDLQSAVVTRLVRNDYRALRTFRGAARIRTFLVTLTRRVVIDMRDRAWGRRRPRTPPRVPSAGGNHDTGQPRRMHLSLDSSVDVPTRAGCPHRRLEDEERSRAGIALGAHLARALVALPPDDQLLVRLRHERGMRVCEIAETLGLDQRRLYRRIHGIHRDLLKRMTTLGVSAAEAADLTGRGRVHVPEVLSRVAAQAPGAPRSRDTRTYPTA